MMRMAGHPTILVRVTQNARVIHTVAFTQDVVSVGREPGMDIALPSHEVSRAHCRIERVQKGFQVVDLGSKNGTLVNGRKVVSQEIESGDNLQVGDFTLWIQLVPKPEKLADVAAASCEGPTLARPSAKLQDPSKN